MIERYIPTTFERTERKGYPAERLVLDDSVFESPNGVIEIPDGPWTKKNTDLPTESESQQFRLAGYLTDSKGRPLHPWLRQMITNPDIGVITGKGDYYNFGPNYTADSVVITREDRPRVLIGKRADNGKWAIPGGFIDPGEINPLDAAIRESVEETDIVLEDVEGQLIYQGVVADERATANAWPETSAYAFVVDIPRFVQVVDPTEITDVKWEYIDQLPDDMHGSHNLLIEMTVNELGLAPKRSIRTILKESGDSLEKDIVDAGHMAYDHYFLTDGRDRLFVKEHDASRFTDAFREAHSRAYLKKERDVFEHVGRNGFSAIPKRFDLLDESKMLVMDALSTEDGYVWGDPSAEQAHQFIDDIVKAFSDLQRVPIPENPDYHKEINPTFETYFAEGWDAIDDETFEAIKQKIEQLSSGWTEEQKLWAFELIADLPLIRDISRGLDRKPELFMAHNDARQSNIGWHPYLNDGERVGIVDWSWADPAPKNADSTMFLIDMVKSGYDVSEFYQYVNKDFLILYLGFLIAHSTWNTRDGSTTVREQQVASASAAHRLLVSLPE